MLRPLQVLAALERPLHVESVVLDVGRQAQFPAVDEETREPPHARLVDEAALPVARLGPGVGEENEDALEAGRRKGFEKYRHVRVENPDVGKAMALDEDQQVRHAVQPHLDADQRDLGMAFRLPGKMLAAAKPDFQPEPFAKLVIGFAVLADDNPQFRQQRIDQEPASGRKPAPPAASPGLPAGQEKAFLSSPARSVFSQENPPSASASRPKWPYAAVRS